MKPYLPHSIVFNIGMMRKEKFKFARCDPFGIADFEKQHPKPLLIDPGVESIVVNNCIDGGIPKEG